MTNPRMDFLSTLKDVSWAVTGATEFPPGSGVIRHPGFNPLRISIAIFAYLPAAGLASSHGINLIEFGRRPTGTGLNTQGGFQSQINAESDGLVVQIAGVRQGATATAPGTGLRFTPPPFGDPSQAVIPAVTADVTGVPFVFTFDVAPPIYGDKWNCLLVSYDSVSGAITDPFINKPVVLPPTPPAFPTGTTITTEPTQNDTGPGQLVIVPNGTSFDGQLEYEFNVDGGYTFPFDSGDQVLGPFNAAPTDSWSGINMAGGPLGIPQQFTGTPDDPIHLNPDVAYAYVQIWTDQAIPFQIPGIADAFFVSKGGTDLGMVSPSVARAQFGPPAFIFQGNPKTFTKGSSVIGHPVKFPPPQRA